jgi:hypothetical protein
MPGDADGPFAAAAAAAAAGGSDGDAANRSQLNQQS